METRLDRRLVTALTRRARARRFNWLPLAVSSSEQGCHSPDGLLGDTRNGRNFSAWMLGLTGRAHIRLSPWSRAPEFVTLPEEQKRALKEQRGRCSEMGRGEREGD